MNNTLDAGHSKVSMKGFLYHKSNSWYVTVIHNLLSAVYEKNNCKLTDYCGFYGLAKLRYFINIDSQSVPCRLPVQ